MVQAYHYTGNDSDAPIVPTIVEMYNEYGDLVGSLAVTVDIPDDTLNTAGSGTLTLPKGTTILVEELDNTGIRIDPSYIVINPTRTGGAVPSASITDWTGYMWIKVAPMLDRFAGINNLLLTVIPVVSIAGFLGISGAKLYSYGKGTSSIGSSISTSVFTLIGIVIAMVIAGPVLGQAVDANQVVVSGQYEVNGTFGNIISLLFAMIPVIYIAGLVTLVGLQARTALMGGK